MATVNLNLNFSIVQGCTFTDGQLRSGEISLNGALGQVNAVDAHGKFLGSFDVEKLAAYRSNELELSPERAVPLVREQERAGTKIHECAAYREAAADHFHTVDAMDAARNAVAGLDLGSDLLPPSVSLEADPTRGPPGEAERAAAEAAAFAEFGEINALAGELETAGVEDARNVARAQVQEAGIQVG